jgi:hypothetical protein
MASGLAETKHKAWSLERQRGQYRSLTMLGHP